MQLVFQLQQEFINHPQNHVAVQRLEGNDRIQTVAEFGGEGAFDIRHFITEFPFGRKAHDGFLHRFRACIGCHDHNHIAEVG